MPRTLTTVHAVVLKRRNTGELDRLVTLLTQQSGKVTAKAKGVRKSGAARQSYLEPGNYIKAQITDSAYPILAQVDLIDQVGELPSLKQHRALSHLLELLERLFVAEALSASEFETVLAVRKILLTPTIPNTQAAPLLKQLVVALGFTDPEYTGSISSLVTELTGTSLKSFSYLSIHK